MRPLTAREGLIGALGFSSGLPLLLTGGTLSAWMTDAGLDLKTIGAMTLVSLPYAFKFLWAPLLDTYRLPFLGRRRGWMLTTQLAIAAALLGMAAFGPSAESPDPVPIAWLAVAVAFFSASQDIVLDAWRVDTLAPSERAAGTGVFVAGYRIGMFVANTGALLLADHLPWPVVYTVLAGVACAGALATFAAPEPAELAERPPLVEAFWRPFQDFFSRFGLRVALGLLLFLTFYRLGDTVAAKMTNPFLMKTDFTKTEIALVNKTAAFLATIAGGLIAGRIVNRLGLLRSLAVFGALQAVANLGYAWIAVRGHDVALLFGVVALDNLFGGIAGAAVGALLLGLCAPRWGATQFALLTAAAGIAGHLVSGLSGVLAEKLGWAGFFALSVVAVVPALTLLLTLLREVVVHAGAARPD